MCSIKKEKVREKEVGRLTTTTHRSLPVGGSQGSRTGKEVRKVQEIQNTMSTFTQYKRVSSTLSEKGGKEGLHRGSLSDTGIFLKKKRERNLAKHGSLK